MEEFYAKLYFQDGKAFPETLREHTENLLEELERIKKIYGKELESIGANEDFWNALKIACLFHDLGKISSHFQRKIKRYIGEDVKISSGTKEEIPHNYLSGIFLFNSSIANVLNNEFFDYVLYSVLFHHNREISFSVDYMDSVFKRDLKPKLCLLSWLSKFNIDLSNINEESPYFVYDEIKSYMNNSDKKISQIKKNKIFILFKGLLHRLDHSASAHLPVEENRIHNVDEKLISYLSKKDNFKGLKPFQEKAKELRNKNVLLTASTGIGKTEFAVNWIGEDKAFYTLPVRVSVNAMYDRFVSIFESDKEKIGLLHSDALFYGMESNETIDEFLSLEEHIIRTQTSRQFSMPITITTADQLFTSVLKYPGYEKIYATLMYSKVVLDEPQSYSPDTLAIIIKGLQEIAYYGGKFCFMSATIHPFINEYLKDFVEELDPVFNSEKKHKIKLENRTIDELSKEIISQFNQGKKVLVITNTVKKAQELYKILKEIENLNVKLLHSLFIQIDRNEKEKQIKSPTEPVIWISTQLVEASLDIDYDIMFAEISTLDSLIQRMGRVYRKQGRIINESDNANIVIATKEPSDKGKIYNNEIISFTLEALEEFNNKILSDEEKQNLMKKVYEIEKIKNTSFYKNFIKNMELLNAGFKTDTKGEAQQLFRGILNINVIPEEVYQENLDEIEKAIEIALDKSKKYSEKIQAFYTLNKFTVSMPFYKLKNIIPTQITPDKFRNKIFTVNFEYDSEFGLDISKDPELGEIL
ncbi:crispr-associated helicase Cas3 [Sulfurihydrogenibium azorense Az-Fu1]|uniref:Crispr-associated helicase Cas3 n=1 Tax=Sulfurihydrogenibium azorense (strain DSM 15241 / OCM 825 / Az-Fu1) TaxID=204536 RepID=C1DUL9_SULAA|nr:CRISPR-associated helicase/endonuclease Cas3 [Sulfurihydrogenibium azorense]ACN98177.1 crispr-associated helicase Cas3 [Sulfurihydrogenibium azorense Az-Fu1]